MLRLGLSAFEVKRLRYARCALTEVLVKGAESGLNFRSDRLQVSIPSSVGEILGKICLNWAENFIDSLGQPVPLPDSFELVSPCPREDGDLQLWSAGTKTALHAPLLDVLRRFA